MENVQDYSARVQTRLYSLSPRVHLTPFQIHQAIYVESIQGKQNHRNSSNVWKYILNKIKISELLEYYANQNYGSILGTYLRQLCVLKLLLL